MPTLRRIDDDVEVDITDPNKKKKKAEPFVPSDPTEGMNVAEKFLAGGVAGLGHLYRGTKQTGLSGLDYLTQHLPEGNAIRNAVSSGAASTQADIDEAHRLEKPLMNTTSGAIGNFAGETLPTMLIPGGGLGVGSKLAWNMLKGGGQGFANAALNSRTSDEDQLGYWGTNVVGGAAAAPVMHAVGKGINAVRGKWRDFRTVGNQATPVETYNAAKASGIPVSIGDIDPSSRWRSWENFMAKLPLSGRAASLKEQAQTLSDKMIATKVANQAPEVAAGEDPAKALFDAVKKEYGKRKFDVKQQYDAVGHAAKEAGVTSVVPTETASTAKSILQEHGPDLFMLHSGQGVPDERLGQGIQRIFALGDPNNASKPITFHEMRRLRTVAGEKERQAKKMLVKGDITEEQAEAFTKLSQSISDDLDTWGATQGNETVKSLYKKASDSYLKQMVPFKEIPILNKARLTGPGDPFDYDQLLSMAMGKDRPARAAMILDNAGEEGRKIVSGHAIESAVDKALDPNVEGSLSTRRLLAGLDLGRARKEVFKDPIQAKAVQDLEDATRAAGRAGEYLTEPPSNSRMTGASIGGAVTGLGAPAIAGATYWLGGATGLGATAAALAATRASNAFTNSNMGKRMYLADPMQFSDWTKRLSRMAPTAMENELNDLYNY